MNLDQIITTLSQTGESAISDDLIEIREIIEDRISKNEMEGFSSQDIESLVYIFSYSGRQSNWINSPLREGRFRNDTHQNFVTQLNTSLDILPRPANEFVYRMDDLVSYLPMNEAQYLNWFKNNTGTVLNIPFFLSTSVEEWEEYPVYWKIRLLKNNSLSRSLERLHQDHSEEKEILFKINAHLKITRVQENYIFMEEVLPTEDSITYSKNLFNKTHQ